MIIQELGQKWPEAPALLSDREELTYGALSERVNRYARWALAQGLVPGDVVCLMMSNRPEFAAIWLGLSRVGVVVALINTNLTGRSLAHCVAIVSAKHMIVEACYAEAIKQAGLHLDANSQVWGFGDSGESWPRLDAYSADLPAHPLTNAEQRPITLKHRALCIFTSGTTGLPKAANVSHYRVMAWTHWFWGLMNASESDRLYNCLPMYHAVGGISALGAVLLGGGSVVIREKFSASQFWDDVDRWNCTIFQYIGELCRYLVTSPSHPLERQHRLRLSCGNGLRADIWEKFQDRFQIPQILEFYAATEGNFSLYNVEAKPGAIGRIPPFLAHRFPVKLIQYDTETEAPKRNAHGFCMACGPNEVGQAIGRMSSDGSEAASVFEGYTDSHESDKKILRNVFSLGDAWLLSGDLMRKDEKGFFYFVDRVGDTFRWKGENVATSEVCDVVARCEGVLDASVYGVGIPGMEGRCGMAALVVSPSFKLEKLYAHLIEQLPAYARPLFLRLQNELSLTATFRPKKADLVQDHFNPALISDRLFFADADQSAFVPLDERLYQQIICGHIRL